MGHRKKDAEALAAQQARRQARQGRRRARRKATLKRLVSWMRWGLEQARGPAGEELLEAAVNSVADHAIQVIDIGDGPLADEAEAILANVVDKQGRAWMHKVGSEILAGNHPE